MTEKQWIKSLLRPILVVGNGPLAFPIPEGRYQSIVRFNNYALGGKSGTQTTHWVASGYKNIEPRPMHHVLIPWATSFQDRRVRYDLSFGGRINAKVIHLADNIHIQMWFPSAFSWWKQFPSVGFCFLSWLYNIGIRPDIIGFDGMRSGHEDNPNHRHGHRWTKQREWLIIRSHFMHKNLNEARTL